MLFLICKYIGFVQKSEKNQDLLCEKNVKFTVYRKRNKKTKTCYDLLKKQNSKREKKSH